MALGELKPEVAVALIEGGDYRAVQVPWDVAAFRLAAVLEVTMDINAGKAARTAQAALRAIFGDVD